MAILYRCPLTGPTAGILVIVKKDIPTQEEARQIAVTPGISLHELRDELWLLLSTPGNLYYLAAENGYEWQLAETE